MVNYTLNNAWNQARARLAALESVFDPGTIRYLETLGVGAGWRCLEVGAGGGSIAGWLARRVGAGGHVLATDIDPRFVGELDLPNLEMRRHDIATEDLPDARFDLIHTRMVLEHLAARDAVLCRLVAALKPAGWILVEAIDFVTVVPDPAMEADAARLFRTWENRHLEWMASRGFDHAYGRGMDTRLRRHGLTDVATEGRALTWRGGTAGSRVWKLTVEQLREPMVEAGMATAEDLDRLCALLDDPAFAAMSPLIVAAWGHRPPT